MGACGSKVRWDTEGRDPMEELRKKGKETGYRDTAEAKDLKGKENIRGQSGTAFLNPGEFEFLFEYRQNVPFIPFELFTMGVRRG